MTHMILKCATALLLFLLTAWLFRDATVFALYKADPITHRGVGCYTEIEILIGVQSPTSWIRAVELVAACTFGLAGIVVIFKKCEPE